MPYEDHLPPMVSIKKYYWIQSDWDIIGYLSFRQGNSRILFPWWKEEQVGEGWKANGEASLWSIQSVRFRACNPTFWLPTYWFINSHLKGFQHATISTERPFESQLKKITYYFCIYKTPDFFYILNNIGKHFLCSPKEHMLKMKLQTSKTKISIKNMLFLFKTRSISL